MDNCPYCNADLKGERYRACPECNGDLIHYKSEIKTKLVFCLAGAAIVILGLGVGLFRWHEFGWPIGGLLIAIGAFFIFYGIKE